MFYCKALVATPLLSRFWIKRIDFLGQVDVRLTLENVQWAKRYPDVMRHGLMMERIRQLALCESVVWT